MTQEIGNALRELRVCLVTFAFSAVAVASVPPQHWPQFRGPSASGVAEARVPTDWDLASNRAIAWRTAIAGLGHSSPIVWGDRIYVTTAVSVSTASELDSRHSGIGVATDDDRQAWKLLALDRATGRVVWERTAFEGVPRVRRHLEASHASATPATNGKVVVALFGSEGLYCYGADGALLWKQDLGIMNTGLVADERVQRGPASSPIIHGTVVIVQNDRHRESFLAAYELADGEQVWRVERDEVSSRATPLVVTAAGRSELVVNASKFITAYDPLTGRELWRMADAEMQVKVPSPVAGPTGVLMTGGYPRGSRPLYVLKPGQQGTLDPASASTFSWRTENGSPHVPTPLIYGREVYVLADTGVLTTYDAVSGARHYQHRLDETPLAFSASPIGAGGHVYLASEDGDVFVVKAGPTFHVVARNDLDEPLLATPAVAGNMLIVRGRTHVFGIS